MDDRNIGALFPDKNEYRKRFAKKFTSIMVEEECTYRELSELTGISWTTLSSYGSGRAIPSLYAIQIIAEAIGYSIDEFKV